MKKKLFTLLIGAVFLASCVGDYGKGIKISIKNINKDEGILFFVDYKGEHKRQDIKIDKGEIKISIKDTINPFTKFTFVIKDFTRKYRFGYVPSTVVYFFASQDSKIKLDITGNSDNTLTYKIEDNLNNTINKDLSEFNEKLGNVTKEFMNVSIEMEKMRKEATPEGLEGKEAIIEANKILKKDPKYIELAEKRSGLDGGSGLIMDYIKSNDNLFSSSLLWDIYERRMVSNDSLVKELLKKYPKEIQDQIYCKNLAQKIIEREKIAKGLKIDELKGITKEGDEFSLTSILGNKYIMLDFWGTWCMPCVKGMPNMKKFYDKNKSKIEIISIACADKEPKWKDFINKHKEYNWVHIFDADNQNIKKFAIDAFPTKIILDKEGKIIYKKVGEYKDEYNEISKLLK